MANKRITDVDYINSLDSNESFFVNHNNTIKQVNKSNMVFGIANGGTGATTAAAARSNLGLGAVATEDVLPVSKGGTGGTSLAALTESLNGLPKAGGTMTGAINMGNNKITNLAAPSSGTDAANKNYADSVKVKRDLLYSNSNYTSEFGGQTITISNIFDYDEIMVVSYLGAYDGIDGYSTSIFYCIEGGQFDFKAVIQGENVLEIGRGYEIKGSGIRFTDAYYFNTGGTLAVNNKTLVPRFIYGIKY